MQSAYEPVLKRSFIPQPPSPTILKKSFESLIDDLLDSLDLISTEELYSKRQNIQKKTILKIKSTSLEVLTQRAYGRGLIETLVLYGPPEFVQSLLFSSDHEPALIDELSLSLRAPLGERSLTYWAAYNMSSQMLDMVMDVDNGLLAKINDGTTNIHIAAYQGDLTLIQAIQLSHQNLLYQADRHGHTPLFYAALKNHQEVMLYLQQMSATTSIMNRELNEISLHRAIAITAWRHAAVVDCWWGGAREEMFAAAMDYEKAILHLEQVSHKNEMDESLLMHCYGRLGCLEIALERFTRVQELYARFIAAYSRLIKKRESFHETLTPAEVFLETQCSESFEEWLDKIEKPSHPLCLLNKEQSMVSQHHTPLKEVCLPVCEVDLSSSSTTTQSSAAYAEEEDAVATTAVVTMPSEESATATTSSLLLSLRFFTGKVPSFPVGSSLQSFSSSNVHCK